MRRWHVVAVDDDEDLRTLLRLALPRLGPFDVDTFDSLATAMADDVAPADAVVFDLVFTDARAALSALGSRFPGAALVGFSGHASRDVAPALREAGAHAYVQKGDLGELADALGALLGQRSPD